MQTKYGYSLDTWAEAKKEMQKVLSDCAKIRKMIPYSELVSKIKTIRFEPDSHALAQMLGEISEAEKIEGHGMLSSIVTHKVGDMEPGPGFFEFAKDLGYAVTDKTKFWIDQVKTVFAYWESQK